MDKGQKKQETKNQNQQQHKTRQAKINQVKYCPSISIQQVCTFPFQYCQYGGKNKKCSKYIQDNYPELVPQFQWIQKNKQTQQAKTQNQEKKIQDQTKKKKLKKDRDKKQKFVVIQVKKRSKKKYLTFIQGLQNVIKNFDKKAFIKKCQKKFATSVSDSQQKIQCQGNIAMQLQQILINDYKVRQKYIKVIDIVQQQEQKVEQSN